MPVFGLVTEGITDQAVLENIINGIVLAKTDDEADFVFSQPAQGVGKQKNDGGWERVFEFLATEDLMIDALEKVSFLVIHLDSDQGTHKNFGVALLDAAGKPRPTIDIISDVKNVLISKISPAVYLKYRDKLVFAIAVHSLECWLLPLFGKKRSRANEVNCERKLAHELRVKGKNRFVERREDKLIKDYDLYFDLSSPYYEPASADKAAVHNESLESFVGALSSKL